MSIKRKMLASFLGTGWSAVMAVAFLPVYIHYLGIESYGLVGFFSALQTWFFLLDMGLSATLNREMARFSAGLRSPQSVQNLLRSMEVIYTGVAVFLALLVAGLSSKIAAGWLNLQALSVQTVSQALVILGLFIAVQWMGTLYRSALLGLQHQVWLSLTTAGIATLRTAGSVIVLIFISPTITAFLLFQCSVSLVETITLALYVRRCLPPAPQSPRFSLKELREVGRFAGGLTAITFLATLLTQIDKLLLAKLLPLDQYGYFSLAVTVAGVLILMIGPIYNVAYPRLTELVAAKSQLTLILEYHQFAQWLSISLLPTALILCIFSKEIVYLWTQNAVVTQGVAPIVSIWVAGTALNGLMQVPFIAQLAHGWARLAIAVNAIAVLIMIPAMLFWVPKHGAIAAAWIWVTINVAYCIFFIAAMHTRILKDQLLIWFLQDVSRPLGASVLAVVGMLGLYLLISPMSRINELLFFLTGIFLATLATAWATPAGRIFLKLAYRQLATEKNGPFK